MKRSYFAKQCPSYILNVMGQGVVKEYFLRTSWKYVNCIQDFEWIFRYVALSHSENEIFEING
jgi:hypothetical protein